MATKKFVPFERGPKGPPPKGKGKPPKGKDKRC